MKIIDIMSLLEMNHYEDWRSTRKIVEDELSAKQSMFCVCGKLATGFHEMGCRKFKNKTNIETAKRLKHLITDEEKLSMTNPK